MIGSLMSRMADAEKLSVSQLNAAVKAGTIPAYVGVPLIQEKMKAQQAAQAMVAQNQAQPPVARQIMEQADATTGLEKLQSNLPAEGYAGGGIVAFADGGLAPDIDDESEEDKALLSRLMEGIAGLKSYEGMLAEKGHTPASIRSLMRSGPKKGDYVAPPEGARGHKFEDAVLEEAKRQGLDPNVALHVLYKETGGLKNPESARSKAGALGVMQIMPKTAKDLGIDPLDPMQNIRGGVSYLKQMMDKYQDPVLATAAYNAGPGRVDKALRSGHGIAGLPRETQMYVPRMAGGGIVAFEDGGTVESLGAQLDALESGIATLGSQLKGSRGAAQNPEILAAYKNAIAERQKLLEPYQQALTAQGVDKPAYVNVPSLMPQRPTPNKTVQAIVSPSAAAPAASSMSAAPTDKDWQQFDQASALFQAEQQNKAPAVNPMGDVTGGNAPEGMGTLDDIKKMIKTGIEEGAKQKRVDTMLSLLTAGLGIMGGTSPYAAANIGQGGQQGVAAALAARKTQAEEQKGLLGAQLGLARAELYEKSRRDALAQKAAESKFNQGVQQQRLNIQEQAQNIRLGDLRRKAYEDWDNSPSKAQLEADLAKQKKNWRQDANLLGQYNMMKERFVNQIVNVGQANNILNSSQL